MQGYAQDGINLVPEDLVSPLEFLPGLSSTWRVGQIVPKILEHVEMAERASITEDAQLG